MFHVTCPDSWLAQVVTRREQLGMRRKKGKNKKGDDHDDEGVKATSKQTNKGDAKAASKTKKNEEGIKKRRGKTCKAKGPKDTEASESSKEDGGSNCVPKKAQPKGKAKAKAKVSPKKKAKASPKASPKVSPKKRARCSRGGKSAAAPSPSEHEGHDAAADASPETVKPEPKRRGRKVATPQARGPSSVGLSPEDLKGAFRGEISHQWKSGKSRLNGDDFPPASFEKTTLSCYYTRSRPSVGLRAKKKDYPMRTNLECYNFSFNLKDVCNIGLAMKCALVAVSCPVVSSSSEHIGNVYFF